MDFTDLVKQFAQRLESLRGSIHSEQYHEDNHKKILFRIPGNSIYSL